MAICHILVSGKLKQRYAWGEKAVEFDDNEIYTVGENKHIVPIFVGLLSKTYKGPFSSVAEIILCIFGFSKQLIYMCTFQKD